MEDMRHDALLEPFDALGVGELAFDESGVLLKSSNDEVRIEAANELCQLGSARAIRAVSRAIAEDGREVVVFLGAGSFVSSFGQIQHSGSKTTLLTPLPYALYKAGPAAGRALESVRRSEGMPEHARRDVIVAAIRLAWESEIAVEMIQYDDPFWTSSTTE